MTKKDDEEFSFASLSDVGLTNFSPEEEALAKARAKDATNAEIVRKHTIALDRELQATTDSKLLTKPRVAKSAVSPIAKGMWAYRLNVFLGMIECPERSLSDNPIATTWKEFYPDIEYGKWLTSYPIGRFDKPTLRKALKAAGIKKKGQLQTVADLTRILREHANAKRHREISKLIQKNDETIRSLELAIDNQTGSIFYNGIEIKKLSERYKVTIGGNTLEMRHGAFDKVSEFFNDIDNLIEASKA